MDGQAAPGISDRDLQRQGVTELRLEAVGDARPSDEDVDSLREYMGHGGANVAGCPMGGREVGARALIVVPTLGTRERYLRRCLQTISEQGDSLVKCVVVGPSAAEAARHIASVYGSDYAALDKPGMSTAINHVWRAFPAMEFFGWLGDDDGLAPGSVQDCIAHLDRRPRTTAVYGDCRVVWEDGRTQYVSRPGRVAGPWLSWGGDRVPQQGSLFRAETVRAVGYLDERLVYSMDYDLFLKLHRLGPVDYIPRELGFYRQHSEAISYNRPDLGEEATRVRDRINNQRRRALTRRLSVLINGLDLAYGIALRHRPSARAPLAGDGTAYTGVSLETERSLWQAVLPLRWQADDADDQ